MTPDQLQRLIRDEWAWVGLLIAAMAADPWLTAPTVIAYVLIQDRG